MFELLTVKVRKQNTSDERTELPLTKVVEPAEVVRQRMVENFLKKNLFQEKSLVKYSIKLLSQLAREKEISQGAFFISDTKDNKPVIKFLSGFASPDPVNMEDVFELGEGFPGQVAKDGKMINISDIPQGYLSIESGLGKASPASLIIFPVKHMDKVLAVIELASFHKFTPDDEQFFENISPAIADQILKYISKS